MVEGAQGQGASKVTAAVEIIPIAGRTVLRLKSWLPEHRTGSKPVVLAGQALPTQVGRALSGTAHVLSIGPAEWLLILHDDPASMLRELIQSDLSVQGLVAVDLSEGLVGLAVQGGAARDVLSKGCGLDFHPRAFPAGRCARTRFAQIPLVVECLDDLPRFELYAARSYLHYLSEWLTDAAVEFAGRVA
jgi:sarcosine oxidase, subunit gamma